VGQGAGRPTCMPGRGVPVALYDNLLKRPYLEYPDGQREYDIDE